MNSIVTEIVSILTSGITGYATGIGGGLKTLAESLFIETGAEGAKSLATFGGIAVVFAAVSLAVGLSRWFLNWITSLGARNR